MMFRPTLRFIRKVVIPSWRDSAFSRLLYSTNRGPRSTMKVTLVSASVGLLIGAGYGGYTHYKVNVQKGHLPLEKEEYTFLEKAPEYEPHFKIISDTDTSNLQLVLFQYRTCPFCCKVRAYLDARGLSYEIVEVDAVLRQAIKWSNYKKVPILLAKVDGGYQQLLDSSAIVSALETYLKDKAVQLNEVLHYYPTAKYLNDDGKAAMEVTNKYFIMHNSPVNNEKIQKDEIEERQWRQWADSVLVHLLSPNVYRSPAEALETFKWFEEVAGWRQTFPSWECALMVYGGAVAMYFIGKRLKKRHEIPDDVRDPLYVATNKWLKAVASKGTYHGGAEPNLADVAVYGILSSIEGCRAFRDLRENTRIADWYDNVKHFIERRKGKVIPVLVET